jgi:diguanylate cyclase (GGDEF)-like protein
MFDLWSIGIPVPLALAVVALVGYLGGRFANRETPEQASVRRELKRARTIARELEKVAHQVRNDLVLHQGSIATFRQRINEFGKNPDGVDWKEFSFEAESLLAPTQHLATQLSHAYDILRQQTNQLMSFAEIRSDPLTGLYNRRGLDETLTNMLALRSRYGNPFSLVIYDIDHFKRINDEHGHLQGDQVLKDFAVMLDEYVRETDIVARFGGEEFVIVLPGTELEGACVFADRMRENVALKAGITVSGGVAQAAVGDDPRTLLTRADAALYTAKSEGRNRVFKHLGDNIQPVYSIADDLATLDAGADAVPLLAATGSRAADAS